MALHDITWDSTNFDAKPTGTSLLGQVDDYVRNTRQATRQRFKPEHNFDLTNDDMQGKHKMGSARVWIASALLPNMPDSPEPDYTTEEDEASGGRVWVNLDTAQVKVHGNDDIYPDTTGNSGTANSWVTIADPTNTPNTAIVRDDDGRALVTSPLYDADHVGDPDYDSPNNTIATKEYVEDRIAVATAKNSWPVGSVYFQLPGQVAPTALWPVATYKMTWEDITSTYAGAFFRAEGGNASTFGAGLQSDMVGSHTHYTGGLDWGIKGVGVPYNFLNNSSGTDWQTTEPVQTHTETRPINYSIRIWKRTA